MKVSGTTDWLIRRIPKGIRLAEKDIAVLGAKLNFLVLDGEDVTSLAKRIGIKKRTLKRMLNFSRLYRWFPTVIELYNIKAFFEIESKDKE